MSLLEQEIDVKMNLYQNRVSNSEMCSIIKICKENLIALFCVTSAWREGGQREIQFMWPTATKERELHWWIKKHVLSPLSFGLSRCLIYLITKHISVIWFYVLGLSGSISWKFMILYVFKRELRNKIPQPVTSSSFTFLPLLFRKFGLGRGRLDTYF